MKEKRMKVTDKKQILVVEDNDDYRELMTKILAKEGYEADLVATSLKGLELLAQKKYHLLISDLYLDSIDGIKLATTAKNINPGMKTLILTGNPQEATEMRAVENEIDLYLSKEKNLPLILKYIENLLSTASLDDRQVLLESHSENIVMNIKTHEVFKDNKEIDLTPKEFELLQLFLENKNVRLDRSYIVDQIWGGDNIVSRVIDVHVKNLRDKLQVYSIASIRGFGYKWNER